MSRIKKSFAYEDFRSAGDYEEEEWIQVPEEITVVYINGIAEYILMSIE